MAGEAVPEPPVTLICAHSIWNFWLIICVVAGNLETHVELSTRVRTSSVESDELDTEEVLARGNATGDGEGDLALVGDQLVNGPGATVKTVMVDLEPLEASDSGLSSIGNLCTRIQISLVLILIKLAGGLTGKPK